VCAVARETGGSILAFQLLEMIGVGMIKNGVFVIATPAQLNEEAKKNVLRLLFQ